MVVLSSEGLGIGACVTRFSFERILDERVEALAATARRKRRGRCNAGETRTGNFPENGFSGLLGIGSGAVKVLAMDRAMGLPFKVSTTTSNFMIGVTAAASAGVYLARGYVEPGLAMPVMLGVLGGALAGSKLLISAPVSILRWVFRGMLAALAIEMIYSGLTGRI